VHDHQALCSSTHCKWMVVAVTACFSRASTKTRCSGLRCGCKRLASVCLPHLRLPTSSPAGASHPWRAQLQPRRKPTSHCTARHSNSNTSSGSASSACTWPWCCQPGERHSRKWIASCAGVACTVHPHTRAHYNAVLSQDWLSVMSVPAGHLGLNTTGVDIIGTSLAASWLCWAALGHSRAASSTWWCGCA
jgi:hypothetical protein